MQLLTPTELKQITAEPSLDNRYRLLHAGIPNHTTLVAVSKGQPVAKIEALYRLGHRDFGENYAQEWQEKAEALRAKGLLDIRWHFIGHLQSNKAKWVCPQIHLLHSLDRPSLAQKVQASRTQPLDCMVEVNIDQEPLKAGLPPDQVAAFIEEIKNHWNQIHILGLMCIPNPEQDSRRAFSRLRALSQSLGSDTSGALSMGMSADFPQAIQEGATHIRVGTLLFGPRTTGG